MIVKRKVNLRMDPKNPPLLFSRSSVNRLAAKSTLLNNSLHRPLPSGSLAGRSIALSLSPAPHVAVIVIYLSRPPAGRPPPPHASPFPAVFPRIRPAISVQERQRGTQPARSGPIRQVKGNKKKKEVKTGRVTAAAAASTCPAEGKGRKEGSQDRDAT